VLDITAQQEVCVKVKDRMESLSVHLSVSILSSIFYDMFLSNLLKSKFDYKGVCDCPI
jgi:hypothetical protein